MRFCATHYFSSSLSFVLSISAVGKITHKYLDFHFFFAPSCRVILSPLDHNFSLFLALEVRLGPVRIFVYIYSDSIGIYILTFWTPQILLACLRSPNPRPALRYTDPSWAGLYLLSAIICVSLFPCRSSRIDFVFLLSHINGKNARAENWPT